MERRIGVLLHPTAVWGKDIVGTLGKELEKVLKLFSELGFNLWQVLPLNPPGYGGVPYSSISAFALNPYLIDIERLTEEGKISPEDQDSYFRKVTALNTKRVDYSFLEEEKKSILDLAYRKGRFPKSELKVFWEENRFWLEDYLDFRVLKEHFGGKSWNDWPEEFKFRKYQKLPEKLEERKEFFLYCQWEVFNQWRRIRDLAKSFGMEILGDLPIFVSYDSADVWANKELFKLDEKGKPYVVAGVPPDYFSKTGQLWGNPLYDWETHLANNFSWWINRLKHILTTVSRVRIDHFRGFEACWEVPAGEKTAINGKWVKSPGWKLFSTIKSSLGYTDLPIVAEDLGVITPEVERLRDDFNLPGMKIFQFCPWENREELKNASYFPPNYPQNCIAYTGTHDNQTLVGWLKERNEAEKNNLCWYLETEWDLEKLPFKVMEKLLESQANFVIFPLQDLLKLDDEARFNIPGTSNPKNWSWRWYQNEISKDIKEKLTDMFRDGKI